MVRNTFALRVFSLVWPSYDVFQLLGPPNVFFVSKTGSKGGSTYEKRDIANHLSLIELLLGRWRQCFVLMPEAC